MKYNLNFNADEIFNQKLFNFMKSGLAHYQTEMKMSLLCVVEMSFIQIASPSSKTLR